MRQVFGEINRGREQEWAHVKVKLEEQESHREASSQKYQADIKPTLAERLECAMQAGEEQLEANIE